MKLGIYVIKDKIANECGPIFEANNDGVAYRNFQRTIINNKDVNPDDYMLLKLGVCDHVKCNIVPNDNLDKEIQAMLDLDNGEEKDKGEK